MSTEAREFFFKTIPGRQHNMHTALERVNRQIKFNKEVLRLDKEDSMSECYLYDKACLRELKSTKAAIKKQLPANPKMFDIYPEMGAVRLICNCGQESAFSMVNVINYCPYCGQKQNISKITEARKILDQTLSVAGDIINEVVG